jgi:coiled-coil domain-containing protein 12
VSTVKGPGGRRKQNILAPIAGKAEEPRTNVHKPKATYNLHTSPIDRRNSDSDLSFTISTVSFKSKYQAMSATHATLGAAADERKARLAKLKSLKRKQPVDEIVAPESTRSPSPPVLVDVTKLHLSGRNYDAEAKGPKLGFEAPPTLALGKTLEQQAEEVEEEIRRKAEEDEQDDKGVDLFKLRPKKPNWDLKRDLGMKLEVLNVRTENAIARMVRERIEGAQKAAKSRSGNHVVTASEGGEEMGMEGIALVEGLKLREKEEEEEKRREKDELEIQ